MNKIIKSLLVLTLLISLFSTASSALYYPSTFYDNRASSYTYKGSCDSDYNCLAYSLGITNDWVWPWGSSNPTQIEVTSYMSQEGYSNTSVFQGDIIAYGSTSSITHFAKATGFNTTAAKWGGLELFDHDSRDPYPDLYSGSDQWGVYGYGDAITGYSN